MNPEITNIFTDAGSLLTLEQMQGRFVPTDINNPNETGCTPLMLACAKCEPGRDNYLQLALWLITSPIIDVNLANQNLLTPLHYAVFHNSIPIVNALLEKEDIDINCCNYIGDTPLHVAAKKGWLDIARLLLRRPEIDVEYLNFGGQSSLVAALEFKHYEIIGLILAVKLNRHEYLRDAELMVLESQWSSNSHYHNSTCDLCHNTFVPWRRRHHCRGCGKAVCATCSILRRVQWNENRTIRFCNMCAPITQMQTPPQYSPIPIRIIKHCSMKVIRTDGDILPRLLTAILSPYYKPVFSHIPLLNQVIFFMEYRAVIGMSVLVDRIKEYLTRLIPSQLQDVIYDAYVFQNFQEVIADHLIFISSSKKKCIVMSKDFFAKFAVGDQNPRLSVLQWSHIYVFKRASVVEDFAHVATRDLMEEFDTIPLLKMKFIAAQGMERLSQYLNTLFQNNPDVLIHVLAAMNARSYGTKFVDRAGQLLFATCLEPYYEVPGENFSETQLTATALNMIFETFGFSNASDLEKNLLLLGLTFFFCTLSNQFFFGTDDDSPLALRLFSISILNAMREGDLSRQARIWKSHLLGIRSSCTEQLAQDLLAAIRRHRHILNVESLVCPLAWR